VRVCCRGRVSGCTKFGFKSRVRMTDSPKRYHLGGVGLVTSCLTTMHSGQPSSETATKCGEVQVAEFSRGSGSLLGRCAKKDATELWPWLVRHRHVSPRVARCQ